MKKSILLLVFICLYLLTISASVRLPHIFSDNMVIQRDKPIEIWGWADKKEQVEVQFNSQIVKAITDASGKWKVNLKPVAYGGPYEITVKGKEDKIVLKNILVGDVWLCSGQSNMEWTVQNVNNSANEIADANYPSIRSFNVVKDMGTAPKDDFGGTWTVCSPLTVANYSAVGYFFARELYNETKIPIGIINSSWGGTDIETWIPPQSFNSLPESFKQKYNNTAIGNSFEEFVKENKIKEEKYRIALDNDPGLKEQWYKQTSDFSAWNTMAVPKIWSQTELAPVDGIVWFKHTFVLPEDFDGKKAVLHLGPIDDDDMAWINGIKIGETTGYNIDRIYNIPENVLHKGDNTITVRVFDGTGDGGMYGKPENIFILADGKKYSLTGNWKYKPSVTNAAFDYINISPNMYPSLLYNAMINPMIQFGIKGAIWYQGENNAGEAYKYRTLFPYMIRSWREKWGQEFPFYWVQLANFMEEENIPSESAWAELREAQTMTLSLPATGQAVIIDIGEANDIHPRNKQDVGRRLALIALDKDYGKQSVVFSGPTYKSMKIEGNKVIISFDNIGKGLDVKNKYGYVNGFAIAGADKKFVWAKAYIDKDNIIVYNEHIDSPVAVRYAWGNNPDVNLFNKEGLPAVPFRTDSWQGITEK